MPLDEFQRVTIGGQVIYSDQVIDVATGQPISLGDGANLRTGVGVPDPALGNVGDLFFDTLDLILYGPKDDNGWGAGTSVSGPPGPMGAPGSVSTSLTLRGAWLVGTAYALNDWVTFSGASYAAVASSTGVTPGTDPTKWAALSIAGAAGPAGADGPPGADGQQGVEGPPGADGAQGPTGAQGTGAAGAAGATGPAGNTGAAGPAGQNGAAGVQGPQGANGVPGPTGPSLLNFKGAWSGSVPYSQNDWVIVSGTSYFALRGSSNVAPGTDPTTWVLFTINGPTGPQGIQGTQGGTGTQGIQGPAGATGATGPAGATGATGAAGAAGAAGAQGIAGPAGPSGVGGAVTGRLVAAITATATAFNIYASDAWPQIPAQVGSFNIVIQNEVLTITAIAPNGTGVKAVTAVRGIQGTTKVAHTANRLVSIQPTLGTTTRCIQLILDGGAGQPATGRKGIVRIPVNCTIQGVELFADTAGSAVVDVRHCTDAGYPTTVSLGQPALVTAVKATIDVSGWVTGLAVGDVLEFDLISVATLHQLTVAVTVSS